MRYAVTTLLLGLMLVGLSFWMGYHEGSKAQPKAVVAAARDEAAVVAVKVNAGDTVAAGSAKQDAERAVTERVVTRWIVKNVKVDASAPALGDDWLRGHDGAALGADPATLVPGPVPGPAAEPDTAEVLATVAGNYSHAHFFRDRYQACRVQLAQELGRPPEWIAEHLPKPE